jgi:signal transduction histidine kinase
MLVAAFLGMAVYEAVEIWALETPRRAPTPLALLLHSLQVALILAATWILLKAWRQKDVYAETLARMVEKITSAQEDERRRIAFELHDGISPLIVSAKQHVDTCREVWELEPSRAAGQLNVAAERLRVAIVEVRRVLSALRPSLVASHGLAAATRHSLDEAAADTSWAVSFTERLGSQRLPATVEATAFRIFQEALSNIRKHASTDRVDVEVCRDAEWLKLDVRDYGTGLQSEIRRGPDGLGLVSMQARASLVGGTCDIEPADPGTRVRVRLPLGERP